VDDTPSQLRKCALRVAEQNLRGLKGGPFSSRFFPLTRVASFWSRNCAIKSRRLRLVVGGPKLAWPGENEMERARFEFVFGP
jgi:hypothetical protein